MAEFGTIIRVIRKERGLTQQMLAEEICSQSVLSRIENNEEIPNVLMLQQICERLNISVDRVIGQNPESIRKNRDLLDMLDFYLHTRQYKKLQTVLSNTWITDYFHSDIDLQRYYYYLGSCVYYVQHDHNQAIKHLETALDYTYSLTNTATTDMEILIISCIGKVYFERGDKKLGLTYLEKSLRLFYEIPRVHYHYELNKIFYNYGASLLENQEWLRSEEVINQGINWSKKQFSYYFLDKLYLLKAEIMEHCGEYAKSKECLIIAKSLKGLI